MNDEKKDNNKITPSIHTLESDLASAVNDENYGKNIIKIITDPNKEINADNQEGIKINTIFTKKNILILFIVIFLIISISAILYILNKAKNIPIEENANIATTTKNNAPIIKNKDFLNPEIIQNSDFSKLNRAEIVSEISKIKKDLQDKKIKPNNNIEINTNLGIDQLFEKIRYSGDESLIRSFDSIYSFGLFSRDGGRFEHYLIIKINNFDLAFKSILNWEKYMSTDLKDIFIGNNQIMQEYNTQESINTSTSTSTSTASTSNISSIVATSSVKYINKDTNIFIDRILKNYDIREYIRNSDNTHILYGFINNKFLLITTGDDSFINIKDRLLREDVSR